MVGYTLATLLLLATPACIDAADSSTHARGIIGEQRVGALMQTWGKALDTSDARDTPVTRVVKLLKDMQASLQKEMDEDAALYDKLACWCNNNEYEKTNAIEAAESKIADLTSTIESLTAKSEELKTTIKQLEQDVAANKQALAEAEALREKEAKTFHGEELEAIQNIENLKAAIMVLQRHIGSALPQFSSFLTVGGRGKEKGKGRAHRARDFPWSSDHETRLERSFDEFLDQHDFGDTDDQKASVVQSSASPTKTFLAQESLASSATDSSGWTLAEQRIISKALRSASSFMQARHDEDYMPSYSAQSGEIIGVLKELKEQMEGTLSDSQKSEMAAVAAFNDLRTSKQAEIDAGEKQGEAKEDALAKASMDLAEAKEDIEQTKASLTEDEQFMMNLKKTCEDGGKNFEERKNARIAEIQAVSDTIAILMSDDARDSFSATYSFLQHSSKSYHSEDRSRRQRAAAVLRGVAKKVHNPELSILATKTELDAFTRVKKAIDDMVAMLEQQQKDEVKKHDWCNAEFQKNDMATAKAETLKTDLTTKGDDLDNTIKTLGDELDSTKAEIAQLQVDLQRASENRLQQNQDFQKTVADQRVTQTILKKALERLAKYYDEALVQEHSSSNVDEKKQTPPVPQMTYNKSQGAEGVMQLLEKLIHEAKDLENDAIKGEQEAQAQYESVIGNTNGSISALLKQVATKTQDKALSHKEKTETEGDLADTDTELEELAKYNGNLHGECDYLVKNFATRQGGRAQEIEALKQAKQILSGADLS